MKAYKVQIGYGPGDWQTFGVYDSLQKAKEIVRDLPPRRHPFGNFNLPVQIKAVKVVSIERLRQIPTPVTFVAPSILRKRNAA